MFLLVPHQVTTTTATMWVATVDEALSPDQLQLAPAMPGGTETINPGQWPLDAQQPRIRHCEIVVQGLVPRQTYGFALMRGARQLAGARVTTLPEELPLLGDKPFTVLLGSCFSRIEDRYGNIGSTFLQVPHTDRPDIKLLAGDQVYLDSPWKYFLAGIHSVAELHAKFVEQYTETWGTSRGLASLLNDGANFFCSDDHEFWNNAPNVAPFLLDTVVRRRREEWWKAARELYSAFQTGQSIQRFSVPPVSFLIADTRMNRSNRETQFMLPADLDAVDGWVRSLEGPGVLVIGQPLLQTTSGFFAGHLADWNLPDYSQYEPLTRIIGRCRHSLVILSGDVHYGRIASSPLRSGAELIEIISSPMSLVDKAAKGHWQAVPERVAPAALAPAGLVTHSDFHPNDSHFLTLEFTRRGAGGHLKVRYWPVVQQGMISPDFGKPIWEKMLI